MTFTGTQQHGMLSKREHSPSPRIHVSLQLTWASSWCDEAQPCHSLLCAEAVKVRLALPLRGLMESVNLSSLQCGQRETQDRRSPAAFPIDKVGCGGWSD
jgi:hypothetical protein